MSYSDLRRQALAIVNSPDPLPVLAWADAGRAAAARLRELAVEDRAIDRVRWTAAAVTGMCDRSIGLTGPTAERTASSRICPK